MSKIPSASGIYFVRLRGDELISVNHNDPKRRDRCIFVNSDNSKYGKSQNLRSRHLAYLRTFSPERVIFDVLMVGGDISAMERSLAGHFKKYRMRGATNSLNEWLENIDPDTALEQAKAICSSGCDFKPQSTFEDTGAAPVRLEAGKDELNKFTPEDIIRCAVYLRERGMGEHLLSQLHHFPTQTYRQTIGHFTGRSRI